MPDYYEKLWKGYKVSDRITLNLLAWKPWFYLNQVCIICMHYCFYVAVLFTPYIWSENSVGEIWDTFIFWSYELIFHFVPLSLQKYQHSENIYKLKFFRIKHTLCFKNTALGVLLQTKSVLESSSSCSHLYDE